MEFPYHQKMKKKTYLFNKADINPNDIFYAEHYDLNGIKSGHYFYCIYSQDEDISNNLFRDVVGLLITTKEPKGYTQEVVINGRKAYVCCDSEYRFVADVTKVNNKRIQLTTKEKQNVVRCYKKFQKENMRQMKARLK